jgi:hypothetical protein
MNEQEKREDVALESAVLVDNMIQGLLTEESKIDSGYAKLGFLLMEVNTKKYWKTLDFKNFGEYMHSLSAKYNKGRSQLYQYFSTVRELSLYITEEQLILMGIAKAAKIAKYVKKSGFPPSEDIISKAIDSKVTGQELNKILFDETIPGDKPDGTWFPQEGFYANESERIVIRSADELALKIEPAVLPDTPDWVKRKEARLRQAMEFINTYSKEA